MQSKFTRIFGGSESSNEPVAPSAPVPAPTTVPVSKPSFTSAPAGAPLSSMGPVSPTMPNYGATSYNTIPSTAKNVLNSDVEVIGSLKFTDNLLIDGYVDGDITSQGILTIGHNATVKAEINTSSVIIHGKLHGDINVTNSVELKSTAEVVGNIKAASIAIEAGAIFVGRSEVGAPSSIKWERSMAKPAAVKPLSVEQTPVGSSATTKAVQEELI